MFETLNEKYNILNSSGPDPRMYHINTIYNFLLHFEKLSSQNKQAVFKILNEYLDHVNEFNVSTRQESQSLFKEYVAPVGDIYHKELKFRYVISTGLVVCMFIIINILVLVVLNNMFTLVGINLLLLIFAVRNYIQRRNGKAYGFGF